MKKLIIIILCTACSCSLEPEKFEVDPELKYFVDHFYAIAASQNKLIQHKRLIVRWGDVIKNEGVVGITYYKSNPVVEIDHSIRERILTDTLFVETVVFHELGHALCGRKHCSNCYSLMNPNKYVQDYRQDAEKRKILIYELFNNKN